MIPASYPVKGKPPKLTVLDQTEQKNDLLFQASWLTVGICPLAQRLDRFQFTRPKGQAGRVQAQLPTGQSGTVGIVTSTF